MSELITYHQLDVRELDCQKLDSIGGADYYEVRQILRVRGEERSIVGRGSDWPIISRDARIAELERKVAELEAERAAQIPPAVAAAATGMPRSECRPPSDGGKSKRIECATCHALIWPKLFDAHMAKHTRIDAPTPAAPESKPPAAPTIRLLDDDPTWRCSECDSSNGGPFTRSLRDPDRCIRCAQLTNGHRVAA